MSEQALVVTSVSQLRSLIDEAVSAALARVASPADRPLTTEEVAEMLGVCARTVTNLVRDRGLPARRVGRSLRFFRGDVLAWMERTGR
jgi:excisionase family DNA binding protein